MNVVVIGGSKRFGKDISDKFRADGHDVFVLSKKVYPERVNHKEADVVDPINAVKKFNELISTIDHIDILLWNATGVDGPGSAEDFISSAEFNLYEMKKSWERTLNAGIMSPHFVAVSALKKMDDTSRIVFITSGLARSFERTENTQRLSYAGTKAMIVHLATALAYNNDKNALVYTLEPWLPYGKPEYAETYNTNVNDIYKKLCSFDREDTGKVLQFYS
jgi:NAD(P)-dependent dehydrogenase (short-subunit alcohol dehydrogenase family)